jgi:hypothetical protein
MQSKCRRRSASSVDDGDQSIVDADRSGRVLYDKLAVQVLLGRAHLAAAMVALRRAVRLFTIMESIETTDLFMLPRLTSCATGQQYDWSPVLLHSLISSGGNLSNRRLEKPDPRDRPGTAANLLGRAEQAVGNLGDVLHRLAGLHDEGGSLTTTAAALKDKGLDSEWQGRHGFSVARAINRGSCRGPCTGRVGNSRPPRRYLPGFSEQFLAASRNWSVPVRICCRRIATPGEPLAPTMYLPSLKPRTSVP